VGLYRDHPLPRLVERSCQVAAERGWRAATVAGLGGSIVEIGFGSGLNLGYHPDGVELVWAVEPASLVLLLSDKQLNRWRDSSREGEGGRSETSGGNAVRDRR
jgi:hypothetical protein